MNTKRDCRRIGKLLEPFLDGELTAAQQQRVKEELGRCDACRAQYERLQKLRALVREVYVEEARSAALDDLYPGVMAKVAAQPRTLRERVADWIDRYRLGLASPVAPIGVAATVAVAVMAATLIYVSSLDTGDGQSSVQRPVVAEQEAEAPVTVPVTSPAPQLAGGSEEGMVAERAHTPRRPRHDERPYRKNDFYITYYMVESGTVIVDLDPDGEAPAVVWHFDDDGGAEEDNRI
jgi:hypothetical protein